MPLARATYQVTLSIGQLPLVVVSAVALVVDDPDEVDEEAPEVVAALPVVVVVVVALVSSSPSDSRSSLSIHSNRRCCLVLFVVVAAAVAAGVVADRRRARRTHHRAGASMAATLGLVRPAGLRPRRRGACAGAGPRRFSDLRSGRAGCGATVTVSDYGFTDEGASRGGLERSKNAHELTRTGNFPK